MPSLRELLASEKANQDLLTDSGKASLRLVCLGSVVRAFRPVLLRRIVHVIHLPDLGTMNFYTSRI